MNNDKKLLIYLIAGITILRLIYVNFVPLLPQEAYYWKYAKNLALSYFDHPPMTAYIIAFFTWIGGDKIFFIRFGSILLSVGLMIIIYTITKRLFLNQKWAVLTVIAINCTVIFSIGSTIFTPDVPLLFCWALIIYCLVRLQESNHWIWWYVAGMALGVGLLSKYTAVLIIPGIFIYVILSRSQRRWLFTIHPYLGLITAFIIFIPVIIWNYQHEWSSFLFQSSNRFSQMKFLRMDYFFQLIGSQLGMLTPYIFLLVLIGWLQIGRLSFKRGDEKFSLLFWIAFPVYFVFTISSFRSFVKMNWLAPAYITSIIAGVVWINLSSTKWSNRFKKWLKPGLIMGLVIVLFMHLLPLMPLFPIHRGDTWTGWQTLAERVTKIKKEMGQDTFIFGHEYKIPSEITFYTPNHEVTHAGEIIGEKGLQYSYWTDTNKLINKNAIFLTSNTQRYRNIEKLEKHFVLIKEDPPLKIKYHNRVFRIFYIYRCYGYKGPNP
jgi:4-amino-4-deoxy-L-arabinose transferase-like glycosyltransferase